MSPLQRWLQTATPLSKTLMAISITTGLVVTHRWFYAPYVKRQRYKQAEEWANWIIEQEEKGESENTNITY